MKIKLFLIILTVFYINIFLTTDMHGSNNYHHNNVILSCFDVWDTIDIVRAIRSSSENRAYFCKELIDKVIILYADILRMKQHEKIIIKKEELKFIIELFNNIKVHFFDAFYDVESNEFFCITLMFEKIENHFQELI